ncbi:MAG: site-2 protease family protein [Cyanobacteria bacterium J06632_22]
MILGLVSFVAIAVLVWGYNRARPYGKLGLLSWLQSVALMAPWLLLFGLFSIGIYPNLAAVLLTVVVSAGVYIALGRQLRLMDADTLAARRAAAMVEPEPTVGESATAADHTESAPPSAQTAPAEAEEPAVTPISTEDMAKIETIFSIDTFFRTGTFPYQTGAYFQGNLRGQPEQTAQILSQRLNEKLDNRYRFSLIEGPEGRPVAVVMPSENDPQPLSGRQRILTIALAIATLFTSLETGGILLGFDITDNIPRLPEVFPIAVGIWATLIVHELGHWWQARHHQVKLTWPSFLPAWQIGSFGAITKFASLLPNRTVLFDVAFAGPATGGAAALLMLILGLLLSHPGSYFQIPADFFQQSVLVGTLSRVVLGGEAFQTDFIDVHPLTIIGWLGLVITALNLMPAGQLDGGRIVQSIYGRKIAGRATLVTLVLLALVALGNPLALYWAFVILFLQREPERPCTNDLSEPDDARAALGLLMLFLMLAVLLPLTPSLAGRLGLG